MTTNWVLPRGRPIVVPPGVLALALGPRLIPIQVRSKIRQFFHFSGMEILTKSGHFRTFGTRPYPGGSIFGQFSDDTSITVVEGVKMHDGHNARSRSIAG